MKNPAWSPEEQGEYDALLDEVFDSSSSITDRTQRFLRGVEDAIQAARPWARDVMRTITWRGAQAVIRTEERSVKSIVVGGASRPATVGLPVRRADGEVEQLRLEWEELTRDGIRAKRSEYAKQRDAANVKVAICAALDDLMAAHAAAVTVADALAERGIDLQGYLDTYFQVDAA